MPASGGCLPPSYIRMKKREPELAQLVAEWMEAARSADEEEDQDKAQSNFTDPESRIMKTKDGYEQDYNCQAGVEAGSQVIVCHGVKAQQNDHDVLVPMVDQIEENTGRLPDEVSADTGSCAEALTTSPASGRCCAPSITC